MKPLSELSLADLIALKNELVENLKEYASMEYSINAIGAIKSEIQRRISQIKFD